MITVTGPVADHFTSQVRFAGPDLAPLHYKGLPFIWHGSDNVIEWIEANIDHTGLTAVTRLVDLTWTRSTNLTTRRSVVYLFGTFASDDDAILFKMRWEGAR